MGVACLAAAGGAQAQVSRPARLPLSLAGLGTGPEVSYHPDRWLTIRRSISFARPGAFHEEPIAAVPVAPLRKVEALTGDFHPFGDGLRVSLGFRQEKNRRLLRMSGDAAGPGTARYALLVAVGVAGEVAPGLAIGADVGFLGRSFSHAGGVQLVTPLEQSQSSPRDGVHPHVQLSVGYRF